MDVTPDPVILEILQTLKASASASASASRSTWTPTDVLTVIYPEGTVVGRLTYSRDGGATTLDCTKGPALYNGQPVPHYYDDLTNIVDIKSDALFILLVANEYAFRTLCVCRVYDKFPCIIMNVHETNLDPLILSFLRKIKMELHLPVLGVAHCDPFGMKILSVHDVDYWLGLRPTDLDKYKLPEICRLPMTKRDIKVVNDSLDNEYFVKKYPGWVEEANLMVKTKQKAVVEAMNYFGPHALSKGYLPQKLRDQDWL